MAGTVANKRVRVKVRGGSRWLSYRNLTPVLPEVPFFVCFFSGANRNVNFDVKPKLEILATF